MLKGGVIMDVVRPDEAKIAEDAGATAVMALERVPSDIRRDGGVARMSDPEMIEGIQAVVSIPVMAKARIGHFAEAQILAGPGRRLHRRERGAHPGRRGPPHRQVVLHRALRVRGHQPGRGPAPHLRGRLPDPLQGRGRHRQHRRGRPPPAGHPRRHRQDHHRPTRPSCSTGPSASRPRSPLVQELAETGTAAGAAVLRRGHRHPGRRLAGHAARGRGRVRGLGHLQERRPGPVGPRPSSRPPPTSATPRSWPRSAGAWARPCAASRSARSTPSWPIGAGEPVTSSTKAGEPPGAGSVAPVGRAPSRACWPCRETFRAAPRPARGSGRRHARGAHPGRARPGRRLGHPGRRVDHHVSCWSSQPAVRPAGRAPGRRHARLRHLRGHDPAGRRGARRPSRPAPASAPSTSPSGATASAARSTPSSPTSSRRPRAPDARGVHPGPSGRAVGPGVEVLAQLDGRPVPVRQGPVLVTSFHPELSGDARLHELFLTTFDADASHLAG